MGAAQPLFRFLGTQFVAQLMARSWSFQTSQRLSSEEPQNRILRSGLSRGSLRIA
jgi:hypothetical protein